MALRQPPPRGAAQSVAQTEAALAYIARVYGRRPRPTTVPQECVTSTCLAHRRPAFWHIQLGYWAHPDGWPCAALVDVDAP